MGVGGPGLHLRLESEKRVAFLGFRHGSRLISGVEAIGIWGWSRARVSTLREWKSVRLGDEEVDPRHGRRAPNFYRFSPKAYLEERI